MLCPALPQRRESLCLLNVEKAAPRFEVVTQQRAAAGMAVHPFHSTTTSLPDLPNDAWPKLLKPLPAGQAQAAVLLSTPDFRQVSSLCCEVDACACARPAALLSLMNYCALGLLPSLDRLAWLHLRVV